MKQLLFVTAFFIFLLYCILSAAAASNSTSSESVDCGEGWSYNPLTGYCYGVNQLPPKMTWLTADNYCKNLGAQLVTFESAHEYRQFLNIFYLAWTNVWVGYYTDGGSIWDPKKWKSVDGKEIDFLKYGRWCNIVRWGGVVQPTAGKRCLAMGYDQEKACLFDHDCGNQAYQHTAVCKRPPKNAAIQKSLSSNAEMYDCGLGWNYYPQTGFCYGVSELPPRPTWENAEKYCQKLGAHLVTVGSLAEYRLFLSFFQILWDNVGTGYYTNGGTSFDATKWIGVDGKETELFKYGKWCNVNRWGQVVKPVGGKRCLAMGYDQQKPCFFDIDCNSLATKLICKRSPKESEKSRPMALALPAPTYSETFKCGDGWSYYPPTGYCYGLNMLSNIKTWTAAENNCQKLGAHLVTINSAEEYRMFLSYFYIAWTNVWVGYSTEDGTTFQSKNWNAVDGKPSEFINHGEWCNLERWGGVVQPSPGKRCLTFGYDQQKACFFDHDCSATAFGLCKRLPENSAKSVAILPSLTNVEMYDCGLGWSYYPPSGYCYGVNELPQRPTWENAEKYCQDLGAHLVTINSLDEFRHVLSIFHFLWDNTWTGYYTEGGTSFDPLKWKSTDGTEFNVLKYGTWCNTYRWNGWVPNFAGKRCLGLGYDEEKPCFFNVECNGLQMKAICKRQPKESEKIRSNPKTVAIVTTPPTIALETMANPTVPTLPVVMPTKPERKHCRI